ncbi:cytochrome P450 [Actinomadura craniellae]|uniref:Cytochrome P450 n=1 Tax=Actinomadura craniellae TaxID=2231787 RepID=A0A365HCT3_9ACTN|nr:cytochrome P450 [Actinomadura craniellae]RAY16925.1 cytochrome P450 [Actinomadura craniellae]
MDEVQQPQTVPEGAARVADLCDVDLSLPTTYLAGPPHAAFDLLRAAAPVAWQDERPVEHRASAASSGLPAPPSPGFWAVTSHELVHQVSRQPAVFSSYLGGVQLFTADEITLAGLRLMMLFMDPPEHSRMRKIVFPSFSSRAVDALRRTVESQARQIAEGLAGAGSVDLVPSVSMELPTRILGALLGMPEEDHHLIVKWSDALIGFEDAELAGDPTGSVAMFTELMDYGRRIAAERRANPGDDIMSHIANAEVEGERLTDDEFCMFWLLLIIAGNETTRNSLSGAVIALQEHGLWGELAQAPELLAGGTDELVRYVSPVMQFRRTATRDVELGGQHIRAGDKVVVWYTAANRDPAVFDRPHDLVLSRDPNPHLAFGIGPHFCLGSRLAKLEISTMLTELLTRYPGLRLDGEFRRSTSSFIAGVESLPVTLS